MILDGRAFSFAALAALDRPLAAMVHGQVIDAGVLFDGCLNGRY